MDVLGRLQIVAELQTDAGAVAAELGAGVDETEVGGVGERLDAVGDLVVVFEVEAGLIGLDRFAGAIGAIEDAAEEDQRLGAVGRAVGHLAGGEGRGDGIAGLARFAQSARQSHPGREVVGAEGDGALVGADGLAPGPAFGGGVAVEPAGARFQGVRLLREAGLDVRDIGVGGGSVIRLLLGAQRQRRGNEQKANGDQA